MRSTLIAAALIAVAPGPASALVCGADIHFGARPVTIGTVVPGKVGGVVTRYRANTPGGPLAMLDDGTWWRAADLDIDGVCSDVIPGWRDPCEGQCSDVAPR